MIVADSTSLRRRVRSTITAAVVFSTLVVGAAVPAWAQVPSTSSPAEACTRGQIIDFCSDVPPGHGFLLDKGVFTRIDVPGARRTQPFGINNHGQVVGTYVLSDPTGARGFLLRNGTFTDTLPPLGTFVTWFSVDLDDRGQSLGFYE